MLYNVYSLHACVAVYLQDNWPHFIIQKKGASTHGIPYDPKSIMHFSQKALSHNKKTTIEFKHRNKVVSFGMSLVPSPKDILHVNILYCDGKEWSIITNIFSE